MEINILVLNQLIILDLLKEQNQGRLVERPSIVVLFVYVLNALLFYSCRIDDNGN